MESFVIALIGAAILVGGLFAFRKKPQESPPHKNMEEMQPKKRSPVAAPPKRSEEKIWDPVPEFRVTANLLITYESSDGTISERKIDVKSAEILYYGPTCQAWCHSRRARRTFRTDRIRQCIDLSTGELIGDVFDFLQKRYEQSPDASFDRLYKYHQAAIAVLYYVGKADGQLRAAEREIIAAVCRLITKDERIVADTLPQILNYIELPSFNEFKNFVNVVSETPREYQMVIANAARTIVNTQKAVHPAEKEALDYVNTKLFTSLQ